MSKKPTLSVLLAFHNQRDEAEASLNALFELEKIPFELIIIDDASSDDTDELIQSLLDSSRHENVTHIQNSLPHGRGRCLNEALQQASSKVIWAPRSIQSIKEKVLKKAITTLLNGGSPCLIHTLALPESLSEWPKYVKEGRLPENGKMLWNRTLISPRDTFINPFMKRFHGVEWLIRLGMDTLELSGNFFKPLRTDNEQTKPSYDQRELLFTLMRRPGTAAQDRKKIAQLLAGLHVDQEQTDSLEDDFLLLEKAVKLKMKG